MSRILRLSLRSFCSSSVSSVPSSTTEPAIGSTLNAIGRTYFVGAGKLDRDAVVGERRGALVADRRDLAGELLDAGEPAAGHRLVGADDQPHQPGLVVQRLEHRHRGHRGAVRVGDDALARPAYGVRVDLADHQRDVGVHPPGRGVVDHDGAGRGEPRRERARGRATGGEQRDVEAGRVGGRGVLDDDLPAAPRRSWCRRSGPRRRSGSPRPGSPARAGSAASRRRPGRWRRRSRAASAGSGRGAHRPVPP